jgi:hypothetical protein
MNNIEIFVKINDEWRLLDTYENETISLNYNLADIQDISSRNSSFSKTIILPDTKNNREAFEYISEVTADSLFNPNLKSSCYINANGLSVFRGNLQLKNININYSQGFSEYEVVIFNEVDTFIRNIGEKYLSDLDMSYLDHQWTYANALASWYGYGPYYYPLIDNGVNYTEANIGSLFSSGSVDPATGVVIDNMKPAFQVKTVLDKMFQETGFTYRSDFFNSDFFKSLIIPHNGQDLAPQSDEIYDNLFRVELSGATGYSSAGNYDTLNQNDNVVSFGNILFNPNDTYQAGPTYGYIQPSETFIISFGSEVIVNFLLAATISGTLNVDLTANANTKFYDCDLTLKFRRDDGVGGQRNVPIDGGSADDFYTPIASVKWVGPTGISGTIFYPEYTYARPGSTPEFVQIGNKIYASFSCLVFSDDLDNRSNPADVDKYYVPVPGEKIDCIIGMKYNIDSSGFGLALMPLTGGELLNSNEFSFFNTIKSNLLPGGIISMSDMLPKKFKQKDFFKGLLTMFNLYVETDSTNNKVLNIEPRVDFYNDDTPLDWTNKIDLSSIKVSLTSEFQAKKTTISYKADGDYLNKQYTGQTEEIYGQEVWEFDNDFITEENKIESQFSPTPIIALPVGTGFNQFPMSRLAKDENGGVYEANCRIMIRPSSPIALENGQLWVLWETVVEGGAANVFYEIPWAGHLDNPFTPTKDLNFGQVYTSSFNWDATLNTLYGNYWKDYIELINSSYCKFLEAEFFLDETDLANFSFRNKIFLELNGQPTIWIVNSISDYNPIEYTLTKVQLIRIK